MKYLFDNCISYRYAKMLSALDVDVIALRDQFLQDIKDVDLFAELKDSHRVFVSCDRNQRTSEREALAIRDAGLTSLTTGGKSCLDLCARTSWNSWLEVMMRNRHPVLKHPQRLRTFN